MNILSSAYGEKTLNRYPVKKNEKLRAWDAADEYLLAYLASENIISENSRVLVINDSFGALSLSLAVFNLTSISDSYLSQQAILKNASINKIDPGQLSINNTMDPLTDTYDAVILKVPKNLAMLEDELFRIREHCDENTVILAAAMTKHIHTSTIKLFERIIGETKTSLAQKKARLIISKFDSSLDPGTSPYPSEYINDVNGEKYLNHANVFSRDKLDIGSRFMLQHIPQNSNYKIIVDLACGNGVLGIAAAKKNPQAKLAFVDESFMAVASAKHNAERLLKNNSDRSCQYDFKVTDCLQGIDNDSVNLIINNPPFHQQHVVGDFIAWQMFNEAKEKLTSGGELWIVGNRHLGYHVKLKKLFGNCQTIAGNKKFVILKSIKN